MKVNLFYVLAVTPWDTFIFQLPLYIRFSLSGQI